jgi:hypothetical protein
MFIGHIRPVFYYKELKTAYFPTMYYGMSVVADAYASA